MSARDQDYGSNPCGEVKGEYFYWPRSGPTYTTHPGGGCAIPGSVTSSGGSGGYGGYGGESEVKASYKFSEDEILEEIKKYIDKTYSGHYSTNKLQATELIIDSGHSEGFCIGNIMKYAHRFGKKDGRNRNDLLKIIHYAIIQLHAMSPAKDATVDMKPSQLKLDI